MTFSIPTDKLKQAEQVGDYKKLKENIIMYIATKQEDQATEMIVQHIEGNNYIKTTMDDVKSEIWFYQEGIYVPNGASKIQEITRELLGIAYTSQKVNKVLAKIEADTFIDPDVFFNSKYLNEVPVQNGILDIKTRELKKFDPEKIFFNKLPIKYDMKAKCPSVEKFFKSILKEEEAALVFEELFGYCLYKDHFIEKAIMFVGDGRNGKSKAISLLKSFLGAENCCSVSLSQMNPASTSVCELHGKLANLAGDLSNTSLKETGLFKEVVGRDVIGAKRKYLRDLFFENYSKQVFACNELPLVYDNSAGFWERWILFEFPYKFVDAKIYDSLDEEEKTKQKIRDVDIILKITTENELSGLLNKALDGLDRLLKHKKFSYNKAVADVKNMWVRKSDSFSAFCMDNVEYEFGYYTPKKIIRKMFSDYCKEHKLKGASDKAIKARLENDYGMSTGNLNLHTFGFSDYEHCWEGMKLKNGVSFIKEDDKIEISQAKHGFSERHRKKNFYGFPENPTLLEGVENKTDIINPNIENTKPVSCFSYGDKEK